jgi:hypothetical protein
VWPSPDEEDLADLRIEIAEVAVDEILGVAGAGAAA